MQELAATTLALADDHAIVREGIAALCTANGMRVLGQVSDGAAAIEMIAALNPDFAILDLHMPLVTGVEAIRRLRSAGCTVKLLILSISREESTVMEALRAGADAYLLKDGPSRHLLDAISFVRDGGVYVSPIAHKADSVQQMTGGTVFEEVGVGAGAQGFHNGAFLAADGEDQQLDGATRGA